jgi:hypothetical protein
MSQPAERPHKCRYLLGSLVALLVAFPFLGEFVAQRPMILVAPVVGVFVAGVVVVNAGRWYVRIAILLGVIQAVPFIVTVFAQEAGAVYSISVVTFLAVAVILILFSTYCVLSYVLRARTITTDQIYAGICMYLMLGFAFGAIYHLSNALSPAGFALGGTPVVQGQRLDLMYFSFITLATLGYGDITPISNSARSLAQLEAVAGTLYIAIFMARLVSRHAEEPGSESGE